MKRNLLLLWVCVSGLAACLWMSSVAATIKGRMKDPEGEVFPGVAAQLVALADSTRAGYLMTDVDGSFVFENVKPADYGLLLSMTGMDDMAKLVSVKDSDEVKDLGDITMNVNAVTLDEAVVTAVRAAVVAKQDTLEFNAGSFHTKPNATVEDLLKKLPGVEVGSDGSITSGGKTVTKILLDGKEFFADDPKVASKKSPLRHGGEGAGGGA